DQLCRQGGQAFILSLGRATLNHEILALDPASPDEASQERLDHGLLSFGGARAEIADPIDLARLLGLGGERRGEKSAGKARNERAAGDHWITSSARASSEGGIVRPRALAVLRLMTNSNLVGCSMGRSPGLAPLRILSIYSAARRNMS